MTRKVISATACTTLRELEHIFFSHTIFSLPIVEDGKVAGLVTRADYLKARMGEEGAASLPTPWDVPPPPPVPAAPFAPSVQA